MCQHVLLRCVGYPSASGLWANFNGWVPCHAMPRHAQTIKPELDLLDDADRLTHHDITLDAEGLNAAVALDVFVALEPAEYDEREKRWTATSRDIMGLDSSEDEDDGGEGGAGGRGEGGGGA